MFGKHVASCVSLQLLGEVFLWIFEVFPGALGSDLEAALGIARPAVVPPVEEVVWVGIVLGLDAIVGHSVKVSLLLEGLRPVASLGVVSGHVEDSVHWYHSLSNKRGR